MVINSDLNVNRKSIFKIICKYVLTKTVFIKTKQLENQFKTESDIFWGFLSFCFFSFVFFNYVINGPTAISKMAAIQRICVAEAVPMIICFWCVWFLPRTQCCVIQITALLFHFFFQMILSSVISSKILVGSRWNLLGGIVLCVSYRGSCTSQHCPPGLLTFPYSCRLCLYSKSAARCLADWSYLKYSCLNLESSML